MNLRDQIPPSEDVDGEFRDLCISLHNVKMKGHERAVIEVCTYVKFWDSLGIEVKSAGELDFFCSTLVMDPDFFTLLCNFRRQLLEASSSSSGSGESCVGR